MQTRLTGCLLPAMLVLVLRCGAQGGIIVSQQQLDSVANPPIDRCEALRFEHEQVDAGVLSEDDPPAGFDFPLRNAGDKPLVITRVETSCGCATARFDKAPLLPGAESRIRVTYNPKGHPGKILRRIYVYTNHSAQHPSARLLLTGEVTPSRHPAGYPVRMGALAVRRNRLSLNISRTGRVTDRIECINDGERPLRLRAVAGMLPAWLTFATDPEVIEPGAKADMVFTVDGSKLPPTHARVEYPLPIDGLDARPSERSLRIMIRVNEN